jgi:ubiquinone/menaquinone biosynthesis C-methylase UbiE
MAGSGEFDSEITWYYGRGQERDRLLTTFRLERLRTQELLDRFLPAAPARVLDVGGGAGEYAVWLSERGYDVTLVEPVALHVEQARDRGVAAVLGDARSLEFDDESFDAALLLGPLYHLPARDDRIQSLREARRVLVPGGVVAAAVISRFASTIDGLLQGFLKEDAFAAVVATCVEDGRHANPTRQPGWFTTAYFHHPDDVLPELRDGGFVPEGLYSVEGVGAVTPDVEEWLDDPRLLTILMDTIRRLETEPSLYGAASHLLAIGHKGATAPDRGFSVQPLAVSESRCTEKPAPSYSPRV